MILDCWENRAHYETAHPLFAQGFAFVEEYLKNPVAPGIYEISGKDLFAKVQQYVTRTEGNYETHDKYIDIQYMVSGQESVLYCYRKGLEPAGAYDEKEDAWFFQDSQKDVEFSLTPGRFVIFFPEDVHKPAMAIGEVAEAQKVVLKVRL